MAKHFGRLQAPHAIIIPMGHALSHAQAHLKASDLFSIVANMRGDSAEEVAARLLAVPELKGLQGPTIAPIYTKVGDHDQHR